MCGPVCGGSIEARGAGRSSHPHASGKKFPGREPLDIPATPDYFSVMAVVANPMVAPETGIKDDPAPQQEPGYLVICWDDPVNLMQYVTHVFQVVFGWKKAKAERHMLEVHNQGKSVLARECLEKAEFYVHELQKYNLHATMEREAA